MSWPGHDPEELEPRSFWRRLDDWLKRLPKSAYWSSLCKDIGKYLLLGAAIAPAFGIDSKATSLLLRVIDLFVAVAPLYVGYRVDPGER